MTTTEKLLESMLWTLVFFGTCSDDVVDPDTACTQLENLTHTLRNLPVDVQMTFVALARKARAEATDPKVQTFLDEVPANFDLPKAAAA